MAAAEPGDAGRGDRRRPAGAGGGARPAATTAARCTSSTSPTHLMEQQLDGPAGAHPARRPWRGWASRSTCEKATTEVAGRRRAGHRPRLQGRLDAGLRPGRRLGRHPAQREIGMRCGLTVERAIVVDDHMRSVDDLNVYVVGECAQHRGRVYGLVAPLWEQAKVLADHITGRNPRRRLSRLEAGHQAQGDGRRAGLDGHHRARRRATTRSCSSPSPSAAPTRS